MPSQDTWSTLAGSKTNQYMGRIRSWVNTPNFGALPKDSKPVNPYSDWKTWTSQTTFTRYTVSSGGTITYYNQGLYLTNTQIVTQLSGGMSYLSSQVSLPNIENSVKVKALGKISDAKVNLAVAFAEMSKTSDLILDTARRIDRAYRSFRRGNFREVARQLNITPGRVHRNWLAYKYGWMPLLMDVKNSAEFLAQQAVGRKPRFTVSAKEEASADVIRTIQNSVFGSTTAKYNSTEPISYKSVAKCKVWCELTSPHLAEVQQLGLTNPALVAWELIPFSFVFDWFIQVGNYLQALTALNGVTVRRAMTSRISTWTYSYSIPATSAVQGTTSFISGSYTSNARNRDYGRASWNPSALDIYPPKGKGLDNIKLITSLALIRGSYRSSNLRI